MSLPNETQIVEWTNGDYVLSSDRSRLDLTVIHRFLATESYWAQGISRDLVERAISGSVAFGVYYGGQQVGFARVITDCARMAYLLDVFIDKAHRGHGLGTWIAGAVRTHPDLATVTRWLLATKDAHSVYARAGWQAVGEPGWLMEVPVMNADGAVQPNSALS